MHLTQELLIEKAQAYVKKKKKKKRNIIEHISKPGLNHILTSVHFSIV